MPFREALLRFPSDDASISDLGITHVLTTTTTPCSPLAFSQGRYHQYNLEHMH